MKKKLLTFLMAAVLCMSMGMTALAAPSPELPQDAEKEYVEVTVPEEATTSSGVKLLLDGSSHNHPEMVRSAEAETTRLYGETATLLSTLWLYTCRADNGGFYYLAEGETLTLTFGVPGVKAGDKIVVLQSLGADEVKEEIWESLDTTVADEAVTVSLTLPRCTGAVAFVKLPSDPGTEQPGGDSEAPKKEYVDVTLPETKGKTSAGAEVEISVDAYEETSAVAAAAEKEALAKYGESANVLSVVDVDLWNADGKYQLSDGETMTITFNVPGVKAGDKIVALHMYDEANGKWEALKTTVADGKVTAVFSSFSPVAFVKLPATAPKTGDTGAFGILAVMAVCGLGLVAINRKKFAL